MSDELEFRRKRATYRAQHRGTKEMDVLVGRYADARLGGLDADALTHFEEFLAIADPVLEAWIFGNVSAEGSAFEGLIADIRAFHGLTTTAEDTETT